MVLTEEERLGFELKLPALPDDGHYTTNDIVKLSQVSGWGVYCCDFLLLPVASCCS